MMGALKNMLPAIAAVGVVFAWQGSWWAVLGGSVFAYALFLLYLALTTKELMVRAVI